MCSPLCEAEGPHAETNSKGGELLQGDMIDAMIRLEAVLKKHIKDLKGLK